MVIEPATSTYLSALDDEDQATTKLYVQMAVRATDEAWQQTIGGLQGPRVGNRPSHPSDIPAPLEDGDDMDFSAPWKSPLSASQLQAKLSRHNRTRLRRLKKTLFSKLALEVETHQRCVLAQPTLSALQRYNRRKCAFSLRDLAAAAHLPLMVSSSHSNFWI